MHACRYGCTKWASEVQLQQLHERYGVPVSIFRCGMILAHSKCASAGCCLSHAFVACMIICSCERGTTCSQCSQNDAQPEDPTASGTLARSTRPTSSRACWPASCSRAWCRRPSTRTPPDPTATSMACALPALLRIAVLKGCQGSQLGTRKYAALLRRRSTVVFCGINCDIAWLQLV